MSSPRDTNAGVTSGTKRVGFILKHDKTEAGALLEDLGPWLRAPGHVPVVTTEVSVTIAVSVNVPVVVGIQDGKV